MGYKFLVDTYETERIKTLSTWSTFKDEDMKKRPHLQDRRGRNAHEHMVHQCVGENMWFCNMLGIDVSAPPLPEKETRLEFIKRYAEDSGKRLASLKEKNDAWWEEEVNFFQCKAVAFLDCYKENRSHSTPSRSNDDVPENDGKRNLQHVWSFCGYRWFDAKQSSDYLSIYKHRSPH